VDPISIAAVALIVAATAYAFARRSLLSLTYAVTILAIFALQAISAPSGFVIASPIAIDLGLFTGPSVSADPYSWVTFEFVHGSVTHVLLNLFGLILISPTFEERIGSLRWAILFFIGGAFGALVFVLVHAAQTVLLVGASAGILASFGAYGRLYPRDRVTLFLPLPGMPALPVIQVVVLFLALELVLGVLLPGGIAWEAHAAALAFGLGAAPLVMRMPLPGRRKPRLQSLGGWHDLATTPDLVRILEEAERADLPETREAWVEKFVFEARCPKCGGPLRLRFGRLASQCGWRKSL
jgi:membrane associated rhomboid family serine protease